MLINRTNAMRLKIKEILFGSKASQIGEVITLKGWVRTIRQQKDFSFIEMNDGSTLSNLQIIVPNNLPDYTNIIPSISTGAALSITGATAESPGKEQKIEIHVSKVEIIGPCDANSYVLQKKRHSFEYLRTIAHLRPRTNTFGAIARVRNELIMASHQFFQDREFLYIHTPIITSADCEGAGELFHVTSFNKDNLPLNPNGDLDYSKDFFGKPAYLTVSGQLNVESFACALSDVYTFGPTFRAENSNTSRHLAEFWMLEPEIAFADLNDDMDLAESYLKFVIRKVLDNCTEEIPFFDKFVSKGLIQRLEGTIKNPFERITYTDAVDILLKANKKFEYPVKWGLDLQSEHERYLTEEHFKCPVLVKNYPRDIKAFYMRDNDDGLTVAAMDVLFSQIGEIIGGGQREERYDILKNKFREMDLDKEAYWWYLELRKYGSVPHAGFGLGFERLLQFVTGMENMKDVIPFPRTPGHADF